MIAWRWLRSPPPDVLEVALGAHDHLAAAGAVALLDAVDAVDDPRRREVGRRHDLHQFVDGCVGVLQQVQAGVDDLVEVVRRDVGGHADRDAAGAVDQQVGQLAGQDQRLLLAAVVVGTEIDRLLVDVGDHLVRDLGQPDLGVAHGRRVVAVDRAEVALAVDQHVPHREVLGQPHDGVVDRLVAVRVVLADDVADDTGRLLVRPVPVVAQLVHRVQDAAMHGFQSVTCVGQCTPHDDAHRVVEVAPPHLLFEADGQGFFGELGHAGGMGGALKRAILRVRQPCRGQQQNRGKSALSYGAPEDASVDCVRTCGTIVWTYSVNGHLNRSFLAARLRLFPPKRRTMKKLNQVAMLFAAAALTSGSALAAAHMGGAMPVLPWLPTAATASTTGRTAQAAGVEEQHAGTLLA
jgi:hypothetical protein